MPPRTLTVGLGYIQAEAGNKETAKKQREGSAAGRDKKKQTKRSA